MKRFIYSALLMALVVPLWAEKVGGITYMFDSWSFGYPMAWVMEPMSSGTNAGYKGDFVIPDSVTYNNKTYPVEGIRERAFRRYSGSGITSITLPKTMKYIEGEAFNPNECPNLKKVIISDLVAFCNIKFNYMHYSGYSNPLEICDSLIVNGELLRDFDIPEGTTIIDIHSLANYKFLKSITCPSTLDTLIGSYGNDSLTTIQLNNKLSALVGFNNCTALKEITLTPNLVSIGGFNGCTGLTELQFPEKVEIISGFNTCTGLTNLTLPQKASLGAGAFSYCENLTTVTIGTEAESIGGSAFAKCNQLTEITIPQGIKTLGTHLFSDCQNLNKVVYNAKHCESNYSTVFDKIPALTDFIFGDDVEYIPDNLCYQLKRIQHIQIPNKVQYIGTKAFSECDSLQSITIPDNVTQMGEQAFAECKLLESVNIGNGLTIVPENAFKNCISLKSLTLGNGVRLLKANSFYGCENLAQINNYRETPSVIYSTTFDGVDKFNCNLQVPEQSLDLYCNASGWMEFYSIRKLNQAKQVETPDQDVVVNPTTDQATITWTSVQFAVAYQFIIRDLFGRPICTLMFNLQGQLTGIRFAPQRNKQQMNGLQFTVEGLESNTEYTYDISALNSEDVVIEEYTGSFKTKSETPTSLSEAEQISDLKVRKILENNQVIILTPDGKHYNQQGAQIK